MAFDNNRFNSIIKEFTVDTDTLREIAADFRYDLRKGLQDPAQSSLRMLKSYLGLPSGRETGEYLALDFGGTNLRVLRISLKGAGKFEVLKKVAKPLKVEGVYDFIGPDSTAEEMFDFIAELVDEAIEGDPEEAIPAGAYLFVPVGADESLQCETDYLDERICDTRR